MDIHERNYLMSYGYAQACFVLYAYTHGHVHGDISDTWKHGLNLHHVFLGYLTVLASSTYTYKLHLPFQLPMYDYYASLRDE